MGAPVLRMAMQAIRIMRQTGDTKKSLIEDCYGLGLVELIKLTKPGYDEGIAPFISWAQPLIRSAISMGIGRDSGGIAATSDNETTQKFTDPTDTDKPTTGPFKGRRKRRLSVKTKGMGALMR